MNPNLPNRTNAETKVLRREKNAMFTRKSLKLSIVPLWLILLLAMFPGTLSVRPGLPGKRNLSQP
jgi:hypothetical protein